MAQIRAQKFSKIVTKLNLKKAVEDIIQIQQDKAEALNVNLTSTFAILGQDFDSDLQKIIVETDKKRLQQIVLNL